LGGSDGVTTIMDDETCNKKGQAVGGRDRDDTEIDMDTNAVVIREGNKGEEEVVSSNLLEGFLSIVLSPSRLSS